VRKGPVHPIKNLQQRGSCGGADRRRGGGEGGGGGGGSSSSSSRGSGEGSGERLTTT